MHCGGEVPSAHSPVKLQHLQCNYHYDYHLKLKVRGLTYGGWWGALTAHAQLNGTVRFKSSYDHVTTLLDLLIRPSETKVR